MYRTTCVKKSSTDPDRLFQRIVRFSNSSETIVPDGSVAARGMAIKPLDVDGTPAISGTHNRCQDFLAVNLPVFLFATPAEYVRLFEIRATPLVGDLLAAAWFALFHPRHLTSALKILSKNVTSPLMTYWSGSPYWLGPPGTTGGRAVKYSLVPRSVGMAPPVGRTRIPDDFLSQALEQYLRTREAVFEFRVQPQTDPVAMPVEDVSVEWDEAVSKPIPIATRTIGVQDVDSAEGSELATECETMASHRGTPWLNIGRWGE